MTPLFLFQGCARRSRPMISQQGNRGSAATAMRFCLGMVLLLLGLATAGAQLFTGSVTGLITDPSQNVMPGARVVLTNTDTLEVRTVSADDSGRFTVNQINPGDYKIAISMSGFKSSERKFSLKAGQNLALDAQLTVGEATEQVEVTGEVPLLATEDANKVSSLTAKDVESLPLPSHLAMAAVWSQSGVVAIRTGQTTSTSGGDQNTNRIALNGGRDESAAVLVDGISVTAGDWGGAFGMPSAEAISEFQIYRNAYDSQYGRTDGGVVSITTKGGGQFYHGGGFWHAQNAVLNANSWTNKLSGIGKKDFHQNLFGGHATGPVWRAKKLYVFGNYEGLRNAAQSTLLGTVPTDLERSGDFSQSYNSSGALQTIYNPFSATTSSLPRTAFTANKIPSGLMDSVGKKIVSLFPEPNRTGNAMTNANNFASSGMADVNYDRMDARMDWVANEKLSMFGTFMKRWDSASAPILLGKGIDTNYASLNPAWRTLIAATYVPSSTLVLNTTVAYSTWGQFQISPSKIWGVNGSTLGLPQSLVDAMSTKTLPNLTFSNYTAIGNGRDLDYTLHNADFQFNVSKQLHAHSLHTGFQLTIQQLNDLDQTSASFSFGRGMTAGPTPVSDSSTTGNAIASALLGTLASASANVNIVPAVEQRYYAWYLQDSWKVSQRMTVNAGLRYEIQMPRTERHDRQNYFDPNVTSPLAAQSGLPIKGGLVFSSGENRKLWETEYKNLAPRIGLAYKVNSRIAARAGYGIFYPQVETQGPTAPTDGYSVTNAAVVSVNNAGLVPQNLVSNPFPSGLAAAVGSSLGLMTDVGTSLNAFYRHKPTPYVQTYSVDIQYQPKPSAVIELGYSGTQGRKLAWGLSRNPNQLNPSYLSMGSSLNTTVTNPFYGYITSGALATATIPTYKLLEAYPQFTSIGTHTDTPGASAGYNALMAKYQQRYGTAVNIMLTYQWSKAIDNASETQGWELGDAFRDYFHPALDRSISGHDVPHSFAATIIWHLPIGRGHRFGGNMNNVLNTIVGGWEVSTITNLYSGMPYQFSCANSLSTYGYGVCRPYISDIRQVKASHPTVAQWFNTSAVLQPASYTIGNMPRFSSNVRAGAARRADLTLRKQFALQHERSLSIQASGYNVSNTPQYGRASSTVGSSTFGQVTSLAAGSNPRTVELSGRFNF